MVEIFFFDEFNGLRIEMIRPAGTTFILLLVDNSRPKNTKTSPKKKKKKKVSKQQNKKKNSELSHLNAPPHMSVCHSLCRVCGFVVY